MNNSAGNAAYSQPYDIEDGLKRNRKIQQGLDPEFIIKTPRWRQLAALNLNLPNFIRIVGIENIGCLLLTFRRPIKIKDARRRFNNAMRRFFPGLFGHWICIVESTKSGRPHFHLFVDCRADIRTGFDFEAYDRYVEANKKGDLLSIPDRKRMRDAIPCNDALRSFWQRLDEGLKDFEIGPVYDLFPIKENEVAVSRYVGKDFLKGLPHQGLWNKGARLISYSKNFPRGVPPGWKLPCEWWDIRLRALLGSTGLADKDQLKTVLDVKWGWIVKCLFKTLEAARHDWMWLPPAERCRQIIDLILEDAYLPICTMPLVPYLEATLLGASKVPPPGIATF